MKKLLALLTALTFLLPLGAATSAAGTAGSSADPVVTLSYINNIFASQVSSNTSNKIADRFGPVYAQQSGALAQTAQGYKNSLTPTGIYDAVAAVVLDRINTGINTGFNKRMTLKKGQVVTGGVGTGVVLLSGSAVVHGASEQEVININTGVEIRPGSGIAANTRYMLTGEVGCGIRITSASAEVLLDGAGSVFEAYQAKYTDLADALYAMGLFMGSNSGYELERAATRLEAVIMLIRLLGEEDKALACDGVHPFTDVPKWAGNTADKYVAYAYSKGYTNGTSASKFSSTAQATPEQYMTFLLRALGYRDANDGSGDFVWSQSVSKARSVGLLRESEAAELKKTFYRDQAVYASYYALLTNRKGSGTTLLDSLISSGAVDSDKADAAIAAVTRVRPAS